MPFVLDVSVTVAWCLQDEESETADRALGRLEGDEAIVPALWWFELRNALIVNERRGRLAETESVAFLGEMDRLPIHLEERPGSSDLVLALARRHGLTAYDASYLEAGLRHGAPLATLDRKLATAAETEGIGTL